MTTWDKAKQARTLAERGLDFADAPQVFAGPHVTRLDDRFPYGETRYTNG
ncbi:BrnT family toxin, partial [Pararhodospirillum oryzae]